MRLFHAPCSLTCPTTASFAAAAAGEPGRVGWFRQLGSILVLPPADDALPELRYSGGIRGLFHK